MPMNKNPGTLVNAKTVWYILELISPAKDGTGNISFKQSARKQPAISQNLTLTIDSHPTPNHPSSHPFWRLTI